MADPIPYVVRREADRWIITPSSVFVRVMIGGFGLGAVFLAYLASLFIRRVSMSVGTPWIGGLFLLLACFSATLAVRAWRTRHTPLSIEPGGRVRYGDRDLCASGMVRSVRIGPSRGGEAGDVEVWLELADGKPVAIPSRYFPGFKARAHARPFAAAIASALGVPVTETR
jgi:hypothetical protein